jgi:hypothetical protein
MTGSQKTALYGEDEIDIEKPNCSECSFWNEKDEECISQVTGGYCVVLVERAMGMSYEGVPTVHADKSQLEFIRYLFENGQIGGANDGGE